MNFEILSTIQLRSLLDVKMLCSVSLVFYESLSNSQLSHCFYSKTHQSKNDTHTVFIPPALFSDFLRYCVFIWIPALFLSKVRLLKYSIMRRDTSEVEFLFIFVAAHCSL